MVKKIDLMCGRFTELINSFRDELVRSFDTYLSTKISNFKLQVAKLESYKSDIKLMRDDIKSNDENIKRASEEHLSSSRFNLIIEKFDTASVKLRNVI